MANTYNTNLTNIGHPNNITVSNGGTFSNWASSINPIMVVEQGTNTLEVKGNVVINGKDLEERLDVIEKVLMIPERDAKLESKYPKLKSLYEEYIKELSKARMWETLKGDKNE